MNAAKQPPGALGGGSGALPARAVPIKKEEDVTDDELSIGHPTGGGRYQHVLKKEEDVATDDELQNTDDASEVDNVAEITAAQDISKQKRVVKTFEARLQDLKAYKAAHGHLNMKKSEDKSLYGFCSDIRKARRGKGTMKLNEERIASLDSLGFVWEPKSKRIKEGAFEKRLEELKAFKAKHGHVNVKKNENKSLADFCYKLRYARKGKGEMKLTVERIAALDAIGFDWTQSRGAPTSFQERLQDLKAYKAKHGHTNVKRSEDKSLYQFCKNIRQARRGKGNRKLTQDNIASLDALEFDWTQSRGAPTSFQERLQELKAYKAKHRHVSVKESEDKSLAAFCRGIRSARKGKGNMKLNKERIASLDALGFDWETRKRKRMPFQERLDELKAYKDKHGHLKVKESEDKSLAQFCENIRSARREIGGRKLTKERIASLDALGFDWAPRGKSEQESLFRERVDKLRAYKAKHGHVNVKKSEDKRLTRFCSTVRYARKNPGWRGGIKLTVDRIASLDALGFDWKMLPEIEENVESEEQSTESTLPPMPKLPPLLMPGSDDIDDVVKV